MAELHMRIFSAILLWFSQENVWDRPGIDWYVKIPPQITSTNRCSQLSAAPPRPELCANVLGILMAELQMRIFSAILL